MTRVTSDVEALNEAFTSGLVVILADLVKLAGIVAILLWMDWRLALVTFAILPPTLAADLVLPQPHAAGLPQGARDGRPAQLLPPGERHRACAIVQLFSRERRAMEQFREINREHRDAQLDAVRYDSIFSAVAELIGSVTLAAIVWAGGWGVLEGLVTFGTLVAFIEYAAKFFRPVQELSQRYTMMQSAMASAERIFELLDTETTIARPPRRGAIERPPARRDRLRERHLRLQARASRCCATSRSASGRARRVGVVGWTGSGKSTLIRLLVRLYDVWEGRILLDGVDVREYDLQRPAPGRRRRAAGPLPLRRHGGEQHLAGRPAGHAGAGARGRRRAVHADRFIERLPWGYDEEVRERGSNFSVGQKQLLSFARAVAFDPAVLVLDEATASVDPETERQVQEALQTLLRGRTSIVIAHRLATVRGADRILVLHHGRLTEQGTHEELIARRGRDLPHAVQPADGLTGDEARVEERRGRGGPPGWARPAWRRADERLLRGARTRFRRVGPESRERGSPAGPAAPTAASVRFRSRGSTSGGCAAGWTRLGRDEPVAGGGCGRGPERAVSLLAERLPGRPGQRAARGRRGRTGPFLRAARCAGLPGPGPGQRAVATSMPGGRSACRTYGPPARFGAEEALSLPALLRRRLARDRRSLPHGARPRWAGGADPRRHGSTGRRGLGDLDRLRPVSANVVRLIFLEKLV